VVLVGPFAGRLIERRGGRRARLPGIVAHGAPGVAGVFVDATPLRLPDRLVPGLATVVRCCFRYHFHYT